MTLKETIRELLNRSSVAIRPNGTKVFTFKGVVGQLTREVVQDAFTRGELNTVEGYYHAERSGCHVAFRFGVGASTQNFCWFSFVDERTAA